MKNKNYITINKHPNRNGHAISSSYQFFETNKQYVFSFSEDTIKIRPASISDYKTVTAVSQKDRKIIVIYVSNIDLPIGKFYIDEDDSTIDELIIYTN